MLRDPAKLRIYAAIAVATVLPRVLFGFLRPPTLEESDFWYFATNLKQHAVLGYDAKPSSYPDLVYPSFLALVRFVTFDGIDGVLIAQALVAAIGGFYLYELTLRATRDRITALIAAGFHALYPYFIRQSAALSETTLFTTLLIAATYHFSNRAAPSHAIASGIAFGLALLTRMTAAPILGAAVVLLVVERRFRQGLALGAIAAAIVLPYMIRNHAIDGSLLPTRSGYMLLKGNCRYSDAVIPAYDHDILNPYVHAILDRGLAGIVDPTERDVDQVYETAALEFMKEDVVVTTLRFARKAAILFYPRIVPFQQIDSGTSISFLPDGEVAVENAVSRSIIEELAYALTYTPLLLLAVGGLYVRRHELSEDKLLLAIVACFAAVYAVYCPSTRYRSPMDFVLMFYAATAFRAATR